MPEPLAPGQPLPDVTLDGADGPVALRAVARGRPIVVVFYREDATPLCTAQLGAFRDDYPLIESAGASLVAISADSVESQRAFAARERLPFPVLSDARQEAARAFGVADETSNRSHRAVFVAGPEGMIQASIPYYNPANAEQFLAVFRALGVDLEGVAET